MALSLSRASGSGSVARCSATALMGSDSPRSCHAGRHVDYRDIADSAAPGAAEQAEIDEVIAALEQQTLAGMAETGCNPRILFDEGRFPSEARWLTMRKSALCLHSFYRAGDASTLGGELVWGDFDKPLVAGRKPLQILEDTYPPRMVEGIVETYRRFLETPLTSTGDRFLRGALDGRAVRTRAQAAIELVVEHAEGRQESHRAIHLASLGCGAAEPVVRMAQALKSAHLDVSLTLVDRDPMALSAARAVVGDQCRSTIHMGDLIRMATQSDADLNTVLQSADITEMLGLFEYLTDSTALLIMRRLHTAMRPGSLMVLGNMLEARAQQVFFEHVVRWPRLHQRSIAKVLAMAEAAGFEITKAKVVVPKREGVYAVYAFQR